jgi:hypothetical protein
MGSGKWGTGSLAHWKVYNRIGLFDREEIQFSEYPTLMHPFYVN